MINKHTLKHLLHQPEKIIKIATPTIDEIPETKILRFPQVIKQKNTESLIHNRTTKFVVHRPNQNNSTAYNQKKEVSNQSQTTIHKLHIDIPNIKLSTGQITETLASVKTKCFNYFNEKAS